MSTGMVYDLPEHFTGPYTLMGEVNYLIINLANTHMAYSTPTDPDRQQSAQFAFAREVDNEIKASDKRINQAHVIQTSISADVYTQKLIGVPRHRLCNMVTIHCQQFQPFRNYDNDLPNPYSSVSDQLKQLIDNNPTALGAIKDDRG
jgi:hypothetical protein